MDFEILGFNDGAEVDGNPGCPPSRVRLLFGLVATVGVLGVLVLVVGPGRDWSGFPSPTAAPVGSPAPGPSDLDLTPQILPTDELRIGAVCDPQVDGRAGRETLTLRFQLVNSGAGDLRRQRVRPYLPVPGRLSPVGVVAGGSCAEPGREPVARLLESRSAVQISMRFRVLAGCPAEQPVRARVTVSGVTGNQEFRFRVVEAFAPQLFAGC